jgi:hypothetical protein
VPPLPPHPRIHHTSQRDHPVNKIIGDINKGVTTRSRTANLVSITLLCLLLSLLSIEDTMKDLNWLMAMLEELNNFKRNKVWCHVQNRTLLEPSGSSTTNMMNMVW